MSGLRSGDATSYLATVRRVRNVRLRELLVGVEGLALLRHLYDGSDEEADARLSEVARILADEELAEAELADDLRRTREQRHDSHPRRLPTSSGVQ
jgi:hypothetical protein